MINIDYTGKRGDMLTKVKNDEKESSCTPCIISECSVCPSHDKYITHMTACDDGTWIARQAHCLLVMVGKDFSDLNLLDYFADD